MAEDGQTNFLGGMRDNASPERLNENEYFFGENIELRNDFIETRRGSFRLQDDNGTKLFQGADIFRDPNSKEEFIFVVQNDQLFRTGNDQIRVEVALPVDLSGAAVNFVQALGRFYLFYGENEIPLRWDGNIDNEFEVVPDPAVGDRMPGSDRPVTFAYNRFWVITLDDTLNISDDKSESFNFVTQTFDVEQGEGQRLLKTHPFAGGLLATFKTNSVQVLLNANNFSSVSDLNLQTVSSTIGGIAPDSVVTVGKDILFLSRSGVYTLLQTSEQNAQMVDVSLSDPIRRLENRVNWDQAGGSQGAWFDNYYLIAVPIDGSEKNNAIFAFDLLLRKWVGLWRMTDSGSDEDDGFFRHNRLLIVEREKRRLITVGKFGSIAELLRGRHEEFLSTGIIFAFVNDPQHSNFSLDSILSGGIESQSTGRMYFRLRPTNVLKAESNAESNIFNLFDTVSSDALQIGMFPQTFPPPESGKPAFSQLVVTASLKIGGVVQWIVHGTTKILDDVIYTVELVQDGVSPKILLDGKEDVTVVKVSTDLTKWITDLTVDTAKIGEINPVTGLTFNMDLFDFAFLNLSGFDSIVAFFPLNEGTGTSITGYDIIANQSAPTFSGSYSSSPTISPWRLPTASSVIASEVQTRAYIFGGIDLKKRLSRGEFTFNHMQPNLSVELINSEPFDDDSLFSNITFDRTKYEVRGQIDWVATNVNDDFETPFREDYAPLQLPFDVGLGGAEMNKKQEHAELIHTLAVAEWFQLKFQNSQGMFGLKSVSLTAELSGPQRVRSIR